MSKNSGGNLDFNGQGGDGVNRGKEKYQGNPAGTMKSNYGRGPTKAGVTGDTTGQSTAAAKGLGSKTVKSFSNPNKINVGRGPTKGNQK